MANQEGQGACTLCLRELQGCCHHEEYFSFRNARHAGCWGNVTAWSGPRQLGGCLARRACLEAAAAAAHALRRLDCCPPGCSPLRCCCRPPGPRRCRLRQWPCRGGSGAARASAACGSGWAGAGVTASRTGHLAWVGWIGAKPLAVCLADKAWPLQQAGSSHAATPSLGLSGPAAHMSAEVRGASWAGGRCGRGTSPPPLS